MVRASGRPASASTTGPCTFSATSTARPPRCSAPPTPLASRRSPIKKSLHDLSVLFEDDGKAWVVRGYLADPCPMHTALLPAPAVRARRSRRSEVRGGKTDLPPLIREALRGCLAARARSAPSVQARVTPRSEQPQSPWKAPAEKAGADELNQRPQVPALRNTPNSFHVVLIFPLTGDRLC